MSNEFSRIRERSGPISEQQSKIMGNYAADCIELAIKTFDEICALEDEEGKADPQFLLNKAIATAGNARLKFLHNVQDAEKKLKEIRG